MAPQSPTGGPGDTEPRQRPGLGQILCMRASFKARSPSRGLLEGGAVARGSQPGLGRRTTAACALCRHRSHAAALAQGDPRRSAHEAPGGWARRGRGCPAAGKQTPALWGASPAGAPASCSPETRPCDPHRREGRLPDWDQQPERGRAGGQRGSAPGRAIGSVSRGSPRTSGARRPEPRPCGRNHWLPRGSARTRTPASSAPSGAGAGQGSGFTSLGVPGPSPRGAGDAKRYGGVSGLGKAADSDLPEARPPVSAGLPHRKPTGPARPGRLHLQLRSAFWETESSAGPAPRRSHLENYISHKALGRHGQGPSGSVAPAHASSLFFFGALPPRKRRLSFPLRAGTESGRGRRKRQHGDSQNARGLTASAAFPGPSAICWKSRAQQPPQTGSASSRAAPWPSASGAGGSAQPRPSWVGGGVGGGTGFRRLRSTSGRPRLSARRLHPAAPRRGRDPQGPPQHGLRLRCAAGTPQGPRGKHVGAGPGSPSQRPLRHTRGRRAAPPRPDDPKCGAGGRFQLEPPRRPLGTPSPTPARRSRPHGVGSAQTGPARAPGTPPPRVRVRLAGAQTRLSGPRKRRPGPGAVQLSGTADQHRGRPGEPGARGAVCGRKGSPAGPASSTPTPDLPLRAVGPKHAGVGEAGRRPPTRAGHRPAPQPLAPAAAALDAAGTGTSLACPDSPSLLSDSEV
ncbi:translation initiation factor IF-2-like [Meles meles]|uniref:translation initiation factor IF-2-like n=1 Tax=Meles meles TaxID=9662 RepID=UPI001E69D6A1|nr:translation initiation factor IF-2-like [Meles meles]